MDAVSVLALALSALSLFASVATYRRCVLVERSGFVLTANQVRELESGVKSLRERFAEITAREAVRDTAVESQLEALETLHERIDRTRRSNAAAASRAKRGNNDEAQPEQGVLDLDTARKRAREKGML